MWKTMGYLQPTAALYNFCFLYVALYRLLHNKSYLPHLYKIKINWQYAQKHGYEGLFFVAIKKRQNLLLLLVPFFKFYLE